MNAREEVDAILRRAELPIPQQDEYERMVRNYAYERELLAQLRLAEARYAEPAMVFRAS